MQARLYLAGVSKQTHMKHGGMRGELGIGVALGCGQTVESNSFARVERHAIAMCAHEAGVVLSCSKPLGSRLFVKCERKGRVHDCDAAAPALVKPTHHVRAEHTAGSSAFLGERKRTLQVLLDAPALGVAARETALAVGAAGEFSSTYEQAGSVAVKGDTSTAEEQQPRQVREGRRVAFGEGGSEACESEAVPPCLHMACPFVERLLCLLAGLRAANASGGGR